MKILHFHTSMGRGGIESMIMHLANEMNNHGHEVTVGTIYKSKDSDLCWNNLSANVRKISTSKISPGFSIKELFSIYTAIKRGNYDVVHLHGFMYYYILAVFLLHKKNRFFYTVHSDAYNENTYWDKRLFIIKKLFFKLKWVCPISISIVSEASFYNLYRFHAKIINNGIAKGRISSLPNLIDEYRYSSSTKVFFHPARISKAKNQVMLCEACSQLIKRGEDIVLLIAGDIQDETIFQHISKYFSDRIIYLNARNDIPELLSRSDALCLSSTWEGLPISLLEALSVACIPICTPVGGIPNVIIDGTNGLMSKSAELEDYIKILKKFIDMSNDDIARMKMECITTFKKYDINQTVEQYIKLYKETF